MKIKAYDKKQKKNILITIGDDLVDDKIYRHGENNSISYTVCQINFDDGSTASYIPEKWSDLELTK